MRKQKHGNYVRFLAPIKVQLSQLSVKRTLTAPGFTEMALFEKSTEMVRICVDLISGQSPLLLVKVRFCTLIYPLTNGLQLQLQLQL